MKDRGCAVGRQRSLVERSDRDRNRPCSGGLRTTNIERRIADDDPHVASPLDSDRDQCVTIRSVVTEGATGEESRQPEVVELDLRRPGKVAGQETNAQIGSWLEMRQ